MLPIEPFLTAYDPSDLPGASVDPLGFDRGYQFLADRILPGLTNVASRPRYFSLLCAGAWLADSITPAAATPRQRYQQRLEIVLRFERLWTLANVLTSERGGDDSMALMGIRGVRYVQARTRYLRERGATEADADFRLLSRQMPYGVVGIYGSVADGLRFIDREFLSPTPDLGARLGESFSGETSLPKTISDSLKDGRPVALTTLVRWGERAHISAPTADTESTCFRDALELNATRWRMATLLRQNRPLPDETELARFRRIIDTLEPGNDEPDLLEALRAIDAYETCFRLVTLAFNRMLWMCQVQPPFTIPVGDLDSDRVLTLVAEQLPHAVGRLHHVLESARTEAFCADVRRLDDVRRFLEGAGRQQGPSALCRELIDRHTAVQRAKLDGGRPKMPWLELVAQRVQPTVGRALNVEREPTDPNGMPPHVFRSASADALLTAGRVS